MCFFSDRVQKKVVVDTITLSASEWQIFEDMSGAGAAAALLNAAVKEAVNNNPTDSDKAGSEVSKALSACSEFGAGDSEPRGVANELLRFIYGSNDSYKEYL
jgi:hypothetical protein